jgi:hypothetical protein
MVAVTTSYADSRYRALPGEGYDGVVRITCNGSYGTGTLLYDGKAILTVAHLFSDTNPQNVSVSFETESGSATRLVERIVLHPQYDQKNANQDLALVWLTSSAPVDGDRVELYRAGEEVGQSFYFAGYGSPGTGAAGANENHAAILRLKAMNNFDAEGDVLKQVQGEGMAWTPAVDEILVADFDNGQAANDALGILMAAHDLGLGDGEGLIAPGDSGGPAFIDGQLAGIASYTSSLEAAGIRPDIDSVANSSFGEVAFWQRAGAFQEWIDQSLRSYYPDAPLVPAQVAKTVVEGDSGIGYAYFLLQFSGVRKSPTSIVSVDYATRNGTALADSDYVAVAGTLNLYPGENQAVIPVEIIGDDAVEQDETIYLDVTNPVGGDFGSGILKITAMRTIANDDF